MMIRRLLVFVPVLALTFVSKASGSSFSIFENGVRASGMGGAFVAIANDGSAIFYNPAGMAFQKGLRLQMDGLVVVGLFRTTPSSTPAGTIVPETGFNLNYSPHFIPVMSLYMTKDLSPRWTAGFGMFAPFGLASNATSFKDSDPKQTKYVGRYAGSRGKLESFWLQPTVAYRLTKSSSIAVGVAWVHTHLLIEESILNPLDDGLVFGEQIASKVFPGQNTTLSGAAIARMLPEGRARFAGTSDRPGYNAGYLFKHEKSGTNVGLMWRSAVTHHLNGKASFAFTSPYALENFVGKDTIPNLFPEQDISASFTTPATYSMGVANSSLLKGLASVQVDIQDYKRFKDVPLNFTKTEDTATPPELRLTFAMQTSYIVRGGYEKNVGERNTFRAGYIFDHTPVMDKSVGALFPDSSRNSITVGMSRQRNNAEFSFFYQAMWFRNRITDVAENQNLFTNGEYNCFAHLFGFSLRMRMGAAMNPFDR